MKKDVLFIQGGGGEEDYNADARLVDSLQRKLGLSYTILYPKLPSESVPDFGRCRQIAEAISLIDEEIIFVGHSLGASMILKFLSENEVNKKIAGIFLLATPFWSGDEEWKEGLKLKEEFADSLPEDVPVFLYHCRDDEEVPFEHLAKYVKEMPHARLREIESGGHQFGGGLGFVAEDIKSL